MAITAELDAKVRELESEINGEKTVTRHILEQNLRSASELAAIRSEIVIMKSETGDRLDRLAGNMVLANAALNSHGARLNVLTQDAREIRTEIGAFRMEVNDRFDEVNQRFDEVNRRFEDVNRRFEEVNRRFDVLEGNVAAILAAVTPRDSV